MSKTNDIRFIGITGVLASGKSTVGRLLAHRIGFQFVEEEFAENPHLAAFHRGESDFKACQTWFFERDRDRYAHAVSLLQSGVPGVILDKPFFENRAYNHVAPLTDEQKAFFDRAIDELLPTFPMPDVLVDMEASTNSIMQRVSRRGREAEQAMSSSYIEALQAERYRFKALRPPIRTVTVAAEAHDFIDDPKEISRLIEVIFNPQS